LCNALKVTNANNSMCYLSKTLFKQAVNVIPYGIYGGGSMGGSMYWKKSIDVPSIDIGGQRILAIRVCNSNTSRKVVHIAGSLPFTYNKLKNSIQQYLTVSIINLCDFNETATFGRRSTRTWSGNHYQEFRIIVTTRGRLKEVI